MWKRADDRISYLDGMRCVAVAGVLFFHYFVRWAPQHNLESLYPYGGLWSRVRLFKLGYFGVELFFMISGFVITLTLVQCRNWQEFAARRYARLAPAMLLFSAVTFIADRIIPNNPFHAELSAFTSTLTFIDPRLLNLVFSTHGFTDMDGSYWTLYVEVKYYVIAGAVYYFNRQTFVRNMVLVSSLMVFGLLLVEAAMPGLSEWYRLLLIPEFIPWFVLGIGLYLHYTGATRSRWLGMIALALLQLFCLGYFHNHFHITSWALAIPGLLAAFFLAAMHSAMLQRLLSAKPLVAVGISSYGLYLLHQHFGVAIIHALPNFFLRSPGRWHCGGIAYHAWLCRYRLYVIHLC